MLSSPRVHVDVLHRRLIHECVAFQRRDDLGDPLRALADLFEQAEVDVGAVQPVDHCSELGRRKAGDEPVQAGAVVAQVRQRWRYLPRVFDALLVEPGLQFRLPIAPRERAHLGRLARSLLGQLAELQQRLLLRVGQRQLIRA